LGPGPKQCKLFGRIPTTVNGHDWVRTVSLLQF
jgi:hypothetical protein